MDIREWLLIGLQNGWMAFHSIPQELRTDELYREALRLNKAGLDEIPFMLRTRELCRLAVEQRGWVLRDAMPIGYELDPMDSSRSEVLTESITFAITGLERTTEI